MVFSVVRHFAARPVVAEDEVPMGSDRSVLRDFLTSIATMTGDLSNITAPPFVLAPKSTVEVPSYQGENPSLFCSGANSEDPAERAMLVLRSFLSGIRSQCYMGHRTDVGLKKPLNAFLGELFLAKWEDGNGTTSFVGEQVSHHPPITACRVWNEKHGVVLEAHNRSAITLSTSVNVLSAGHVVKSFTKRDEHYLIPIPDFKVRGLLSAAPYPDLTGTYYIPCTSGYMSVVHFSEQGFFGGSAKQHSFEAHVYKESDGEGKPLYTMKGQWHNEFVIHNHTKKEDVETFNVQKQAIDNAPPMVVESLDRQDDWESRKAWQDVITGIKTNDMRATTQAKNKVEQGQRQMRKDEAAAGKEWETLFFKPAGANVVVERLTAMLPRADLRKSKVEPNAGWKFDVEEYNASKKPYHVLRPDNTKTTAAKAAQEQSSKSSIESRRGTEGVTDGKKVEV